MTAINMAGKRFASVIGIRKVGISASRDLMWEFLCDCGVTFNATGYAVRCGRITTCPTCSRIRSATASTKHGMTETPEFSTWTDIQTRCHNEKSTSFDRYGGRGIIVCERWRAAFENFLMDMGPRPSAKHSIDRVDNNGNYEPGNCRWATVQEQANNKSNNVIIEIEGESKTLSEWARFYKTPYADVWRRYRSGITGMALFRTTRRQITHQGITDTVSGWAKRTGLKPSTITMRLTKYRWPVSRALSEGALL